MAQLSLRWVMPDLNGTGEVEIGCLDMAKLSNTTVFVNDLSNGGLKCASVSDAGRMRIGLPTSKGDKIRIDFFAGKDQVKDYASCKGTFPEGTQPLRRARSAARTTIMKAR